jgi:AcrR family transcriptional regulator
MKEPTRSPVISTGRSRTQESILEATRQLLSRGEAFAKLSIHRIVEEAGISRATFYLHFRTKKELIAALAQKETEAWFSIASTFLGDVGSDRVFLELTLSRVLDAWRMHRPVLSGIIELAEYDTDTREAWRDTIHRVAASLAMSIAISRPNLTNAQADQLARLITWAGERILHQEAENPSDEKDSLLIWSMAELMWRLMREP